MKLVFARTGFASEISDEDADLQSYDWHTYTAHGGRYRYFCRRPSVSGKQKMVALHREVAARMGDLTRMVVDHINGDTMDNRRENLRLVTMRENARNRGNNRNNARGSLGVTFTQRRAHLERPWKATINQKHLGFFATKEEAEAARLAAEKESWGIQPRRAEAHGAVA